MTLLFINERMIAMKKENKVNLIKIITAAILLVVAYFIDKFISLPMWASLMLFFVPYLIVGYDVIIEAGENILHGIFSMKIF